MKKKEKYIKIVIQVSIFLLLLIWFTIPLLKEIRLTSSFTKKNEYIFIKILGIVGINIFVIYILKKFINKEDKKEYFKEILPIFIFTLYMIWTLISSIFSPNTKNAFYGTDYRKDGYITYLVYAGFFGCAFLIKSKKLKNVLLNTFILISILNIIFIELANHYYFFNLFFIKKDIITAVFANSNHYGYYLLLTTLIANLLFITQKNKYMKIIYLLAYTFLLYYLILNNTFGCYIAMCATLIIFLIYCLHKKKKIYLSILSIIIFVVMSCFVQEDGENIAINNISILCNDIYKIVFRAKKDENKTNEMNDIGKAGSGRMKLWINGIKFFMESPILGYGPENLETKYAEVNINQDRPHNLLIQLATTSGLPGLILYLCAIRNNYKKRI